MRTDSVRLAPEALEAARSLIQLEYGPEYLPAKAKQYSTKKNSQDAHEAIRPTNLEHPPEAVKSFLSRDQFLLYSLIWKRFMASQMNPAVYDTVSADIQTNTELLLRATGSIIKFRGFLAVYEEKEDDEEKDGESRRLPELNEGDILDLLKVTADQAFTRPPPRFTEASLIKELEKSGIGRPSTYTSIMNKIQSRDYTVKEGNRLKPTELGKLIVQMLEMCFDQIMDVSFTANLEDQLEQVAADGMEWRDLLAKFWEQFEPALEVAEKEMLVPKVMTDIDCPKCKSKLQKIWYRGKYFYGCSKYPDCDYSAPIEELAFNKDDYAEDFNWEQPCPQCASEMKLRHGRYGAFLGCSKYPDCRGIVNIPKKGESFIAPEDLPQCPAIGCDGRLVARKSRFGKTFYSCSTFPDCNVIVNQLEELATKYADHPKTAYEKKTRGKKAAKTTKKAAPKKKKAPAKPRNVKPSPLSPELAAVVGADSMPRPEVMKKVWEYIKANRLQSTQDGRIIEPDEALAKVLGGPEPVKMFAMTKLVSAHIGKAGDSK
jgi:DNA topoisomerase-1